MFRMYRLALFAGVLLAARAALAADARDDAGMRQLASVSGCLTCHGIEAGRPGPNGGLPIGPAWEEVAQRYKGKPGTAEVLTRLVLEGSSPNGSHWAGKISGLPMPPNAVAIKESDARRLVDWILSLN